MNEAAAERRVIVITGCTASAKGAVARGMAHELGAEILSIDSMKVYRGMDIGTAKPSAAERAAVPHHLVDVVAPWEPFSAGQYVERADRAVDEAHARGKPIIAVGGTVLYLKCLYEGMIESPAADADFRDRLRKRAAAEGAAALHAELARADAAAAERIHPNDLRRIERALEVLHLTGQPISALQQQWSDSQLRRPDWNWTLLGLRRDKEIASRLINDRARRMIADGLEDEARAIWSDPRGVSPQAAQAVGYAEWFACFEGRIDRRDAIERIKIHSRHLAKHQRSWLRRMRDIQWIDLRPQDEGEHGLQRALEIIGRASKRVSAHVSEHVSEHEAQASEAVSE